MKKLFILIISILLLLIYAKVSAQDCSANLEDAQLRYDQGRIQDIEGLVLRCIDAGSYNKAQSEQALRLLILSYIFQGEDGKADSSMFRLLRTSHEFTPDQTLDPVEFINLHNTYRTEPIFSVGLKGGANMTQAQVTTLYTTGQAWDPGEHEYSARQGILGGIAFEYEFAPRFKLYPELIYATRVIDNTEVFSYLTDFSSTLEYKKEEVERHAWVELPISVQYRFTDTDIRPYVNAGGMVSYMLSGEYSTSESQLTKQGIKIQNTLGDNRQDRENLNFYAFLGGGLKIKVFEGFVVAELRANYGFREVSTGVSAFDPENSSEFVRQNSINQRISSDAYRTHFASFTVGYTLNIYNMEKRK